MTNRYARQAVLPEIGDAGQARLGAASVLVVGAGGLGLNAIAVLKAKGHRRIVVVDVAQGKLDAAMKEGA